MGTRNNGLWRSTDFGATWAQVTSFTALGQSGLGVGWIEFDSSSATAGNVSQRIYVGVAGSSNTIYRSVDGGATWALVPGQPAAGMPHHGKLAAGNGTLYVTYGDQPGPYQMATGAVWKYTVSSGAWTNITPLVPFQNGEQGFGYGGLAVDGTSPNTLMVATMSRWGPVDDIFRSTNGGTSWVSVTARKTMDTSAAPYLNWHATPKLGWMIGSLEIDPFNSNKFLYGTGATVFGSDQATTLDAATGTITISSRAQGLEETAVLDLISPPSGPPLISALGDIGAFRHDSLSTVPALGMADNPIYGSTNSLDYAELAPSVVLRIGNQAVGDVTRAAYSTNGATSWQPVATEPENPEGSGYAAVSADGASFVWAPSQRPPSFSLNRGSTWAASTGGVPAGAQVRSDRVNSNKFYAFINGTFYVSTNRGASFTAAATGLPTGSLYFKAVPGREGDIWLTTGYGGLYHSTNSGASFTQVAGVTEAYTVGFGMAAPGQSYQAVYLNGIIDGVNGVFRSDNAGVTWVRINDDAHQYGWIGRAITGDPRVYGRVYFSTNGRGIVYGDRVGGGSTDTTAPSTPGTPAASAITATGATLSWTASTDNTAVAGYDVINAANTVVATSTTTSAALTGLTGSTQYVLRVRARDAAGNTSTPSVAVTFTTSAPPPDVTPPSTPGTPTASAVAATGLTLSWTASTDAIGVVGYDIFREAGATDVLVGQSTTTSFAVTGLTASTAYQFYVRARDAAGNVSANSGLVSVTTGAPGTGGCAVAYNPVSQWSGGFQAEVKITNNATVAITGWTLAFAFANGQTITQIWGATATQAGVNVTAHNVDYTATLAANGGSQTFGFIGGWNGTTNAKPTAFTLNGTACTAS
jgi:chitodextrinase